MAYIGTVVQCVDCHKKFCIEEGAGGTECPACGGEGWVALAKDLKELWEVFGGEYANVYPRGITEIKSIKATGMYWEFTGDAQQALDDRTLADALTDKDKNFILQHQQLMGDIKE